ncbi:olpB [Symbiodinium necroappetens]|uniref:OlpB protein n=1 Tax=Symbiodinium necroappetens TaxID=1628268 RepID=A0A813CHU5_9DINO|nr:olpB [Symbiodinium necroappetens]
MEAGAGFSSMSSQWAATAQLFDSSLQNSLCLTPSSCASTTRTAPFRTPTPPPRTRAGAMKGDGNSSDYSDDFEAPAPRPQPPGAPPPPGPTPQPAPRPPGPPVAPPTSSASLAPSLPAAAPSNLPPSMPPPLPPGAPAVPAAPAPARAPLMPEPPAPPTTSPAPPATVPQAPLAPSMLAAPLPPAAPVAPAPPTPPSLSFGTYAGEATRDDESLLRILGEVSPPPPPARSPTASRSPGGSRKSPSRKGDSPEETTKVHVVVQHLAELCEPISMALCLSDFILEKDVKVAGVHLRRGMRLVPWEGLERCQSYASLLHCLEQSTQLTFEWPQVTPPAPDFMFVSYEWICPQFLQRGFDVPQARALPTLIQVPEASSAVALLRRVIPGIEDFIDGPPRNLWQLSGMDRVPQKLREHILKDFTDWVSTTANGVSMLGWWVGGAVKTHGQQVHPIHVGFPAFQEVHPLAHATGQRYTLGMRLDASQSGFWHLQLSSKGFPTRSSAGETCRLLAAHLHRPFDLSPLLDVGSLARCPDSAAGVLLRREAGRFIPLREAAEYYGRAALLLTKAETLQDHELNRAATGLQLERQHLLHEAREALGTALHGLPGRGQKKSKEGPGPERRAGSSSDPRMWYLLGLVMCSLGSESEGRQAYRQALSLLPKGLFAHAVYFNSALIYSRDAMAGNSAAEAAAKRALHEFRRCCRGMLRSCVEVSLRSCRNDGFD